MAKAGLVTVPTFIFEQGDVFAGEGDVEYPIQVCYYNGRIELIQNGESILIRTDLFKSLGREVQGNIQEATGWLGRTKVQNK